MFRSIRWRLITSYLLLTLLTATLVGVLVLTLVKNYTERQELAAMRANAEAVAKRAESLLWPVVHVQALQELAQTASSLGHDQVRILDAQRRVLAQSSPDHDADAYVWIVPPTGVSFEDPTIGSLIFSLSTFRTFLEEQHTSGPGLFFGQFLEQFPPDSEWVLVRRIEEPWGNRLVFEATDNRSISLATPAGAGVPGERETVQMRVLERVRTDSLPAEEADPADFQSITLPIGDANAPLGYVQVIRRMTLSQRALATTQRSLLLASLGALLLSMIVGFVVSHNLTAPLQGLAAATSAMSQGDLTVRAEVRGGAELEQVATQFNRMAEALENSFAELQMERDALRRFVADASHELRTPITALKNFIELLQGPAAEDSEARAEFLAESQQQIERLEWITHHLLNLSRFDAGLVTLKLAEHDIKDLLQAAIAPFLPQATEKDITLLVMTPLTSFRLTCDRPRIELALSNILENALRHTPVGGEIVVGAEQTDGVVHLWVQDNGPGIDPKHRPHIFERFYHVDSDGTGLGLAIVKSIVTAHGGAVFLDDSIPKGSKFVIELPAEV